MKIFPLDFAELAEIIKEDEMPLLKVDYKNSRIKGQFFLNYVANLELCVDIPLDNGVDLELLSQYISNKYDLDIWSLNKCFAQVLLDIKEVDFGEYYKRIITKKQSLEFYKQNKEYLDELIRFLDSLLTAIPFVNDEYKDTMGKALLESGAVEFIEDEALQFGINTVKVLELQDFMPLYFNGEVKTKPAYYKHQMEGNFYQGNSFFNYLTRTDNMLMVIYTGITEEWISSDQFLKVTGV